jgi:hypothetical protein
LFGHLRLIFNFQNHRQLKVKPRSLATPNAKKIEVFRGSPQGKINSATKRGLPKKIGLIGARFSGNFQRLGVDF